MIGLANGESDFFPDSNFPTDESDPSELEEASSENLGPKNMETLALQYKIQCTRLRSRNLRYTCQVLIKSGEGLRPAEIEDGIEIHWKRTQSFNDPSESKFYCESLEDSLAIECEFAIGNTEAATFLIQAQIRWETGVETVEASEKEDSGFSVRPLRLSTLKHHLVIKNNELIGKR